MTTRGITKHGPSIFIHNCCECAQNKQIKLSLSEIWPTLDESNRKLPFELLQLVFAPVTAILVVLTNFLKARIVIFGHQFMPQCNKSAVVPPVDILGIQGGVLSAISWLAVAKSLLAVAILRLKLSCQISEIQQTWQRQVSFLQLSIQTSSISKWSSFENMDNYTMWSVFKMQLDGPVLLL